MNREAALRFLNAFNTNDLATMEQLLAPDVRAIRPNGTIEGRDALLQAAADRPAGTGLQELTVSLGDRTIEEAGDTVTTTVSRVYHWKESGEFAHSMLVSTALTFRDGQIVSIEELPPQRTES